MSRCFEKALFAKRHLCLFPAMFDSGEPSVQMMVLIALDSLQLLLELVAKRNPCQLAHNLFNLLQLSHTITWF